MSVTILGQPIILLNTAAHAQALLDKKSTTYSDRPVLFMGGEIVGWRNTLALTPYGPRFRALRRMLHALMGTRAAMDRFVPVEEQETARLLRRIVERPEHVAEGIRKCAILISSLCVCAAVLTNGLLGPRAQSSSVSRTVTRFARRTIRSCSASTRRPSSSRSPPSRAPSSSTSFLFVRTGSYISDAINANPCNAVRYIPAWMPGSGFQRKAAAWRTTLMRMADMPHEFVKQQMVRPCRYSLCE
jgi:hypothetical protein